MENKSGIENDESREERPSRMVLTVTEDTPADMLAGSMELLVQMPRDHHLHTQRVTVQRSTPMMDLLVQIATAHKLAASSYTLQAIGERGLVLPHQPNTPIGALDALQVKLLPKQGTFLPRKTKQANQPFETTFRLQVHLPRNQLYVSRVSPKMNLGEILTEVCREKNLDRNKYELRHPANHEETLDLSLSLQDYHLQEVTLYAKQGRTLGSALSTQDIMALQRQEERRRHQAKQGVFGFMFKKSKESSLSTDSLGGRSVSPARSDETGRSASPLQPPARPQRKRRPAPKPPVLQTPVAEETSADAGKEKMVISHSRNSSDSSGYHEASVLSDNPDLAARLPETLPRRNRAQGSGADASRKLAHTSQSSKSLGNLAAASAGGLSHAVSTTSLSSTGLRKKRVAPPPPVPRPLSSAISTQALERIVDSEESLTSDMDPSKPPSDIGAPSKASSDIDDRPKASSDIGVATFKAKSVHGPAAFESKSEAAPSVSERSSDIAMNSTKESMVGVEQRRPRAESVNAKLMSVRSAVSASPSVEDPSNVESARVPVKRDGEEGLSETDILLQKVSDTLSNSLPISPSSPLPVLPTVELYGDAVDKERGNSTVATCPPAMSDEAREMVATSEEKAKATSKKDSQTEAIINGSDNINVNGNNNGNAANLTMNSQQDTSDYVSAVGEDLSISEWEYQLPAPPSAFRDTNSPVFDGYDTITLRSVEAFREAAIEDQVDSTAECRERSVAEHLKKLPNGTISNESTVKEETTSRKKQKALLPDEMNSGVERPIETKSSTKQTYTNRVNLELKKEVITELEGKIETGSTLAQNPQKEADTKRVADRMSPPKIAPIDNTLSNFTITTYTRQKSLNIYDEIEDQQQQQQQQPSAAAILRSYDDRTVKTFGTMSRSNKNTTVDTVEDKSMTKQYNTVTGDRLHGKSTENRSNAVLNVGASINRSSKTLEPKILYSDSKSVQRRDSFNSGNDKTNVYRSKSYISMSNNEKYKSAAQENGGNAKSDSGNADGMKRSTSITNLNGDVPRGNEKFSQWRENILKRQEEPTKEKQLQSLQVLKSILPQLKNAQQVEENVSKEYNSIVVQEYSKHETSSNEHSVESNAVSTRQSQATSTPGHKKTESKEANTKRYTYTGPPAISLGSWTERPCVNVQIKMDTDYKLGTSNSVGKKTIVNINGSKDERSASNCTESSSTILEKNSVNGDHLAKYKTKALDCVDKKEPDELTKKLITHTTASGFKKPNLNKISTLEGKSLGKSEDRPIVTGVELKKVFAERHDSSKSNENEIDTSPVNFKELARTFSQDASLATKPKRIVGNRHSSHYDAHSESIQNIVNFNVKQNGHDDSAKANLLASGGQNNVHHQLKKFTSVVGIHPQTQNGNLGVKSNHSSVKISPPMPVVKGFKVQADSTASNYVKQNGVTTDCAKRGDPQIPKPPTMPIITGVTLKSSNARPKSMPAQVDSRDVLLESIRNFGGREKLKSAAGRY